MQPASAATASAITCAASPGKRSPHWRTSMASKQCDHVKMRRFKTGGWFCDGMDCDFTIPEPAPISGSSKIQLTLPGEGGMGGELYLERASDSFAVNLNGQLMFLALANAGKLR